MSQAGAPQLGERWRACAGSDPDGAVAACTAIVASGRESSANLAVAHYNRGIAYRHKRAFARAIADGSRAIRLRPDYIEAYVERGIAYYETRQFERAIADDDAAIRLKPDLAETYNNRCLAYLKLAQYARATRDFDQTIRLDKNYGNALINRSLGSTVPDGVERSP